MDSFRVALFSGNYNHIRDGVSQTLNRLVEFLERSGVEILVFAPSVENPQVDHAGTLEVVPSTAMPGRPEYRISLRLPRKQREVLESFDPDIVHVATPDLLGLQAIRWAKKMGKCIVSSYHTHFASYLRYYGLRWLEPAAWSYLRWFYGKAVQVHAPTPSMVDTLRENHFEGDLRVWSRGVDPAIFSSDKRDMEWRRALGISDEELIVLYVSRLVWEKNPDYYARIVKEVKRRHEMVRPVVVGAGPAMGELREMLPEAVYTGYLHTVDLARAYASSDIFLFPSISEAFGNVTLEAMACGLPCVVADAPGVKSLVDHEENGYVIPIERPELFVERVSLLVSDEKLRERMGAESLLKCSRYSWDNVNGELLSGYQEALNRKENGC